MTPTTPLPAPRLRGWGEYVADLLRHLVALLVAFVIVYLVISGGSIVNSGTADELLGMLRVLSILIASTLLGHGLTTRFRRRVSLVASAFFTWFWLVILMSLPMLVSGQDAFIANLWLSLLVGLPVVALMTVLRAFVPVFQVRAGGERVRPVMSSSGR